MNERDGLNMEHQVEGTNQQQKSRIEYFMRKQYETLVTIKFQITFFIILSVVGILSAIGAAVYLVVTNM